MIKTVSFEMAKKLNKAGFEKETDYRWVHFKAKKNVMEAKIDYWKVVNEDWDHDRLGYAAPTTDELLEEFPKQIVNKDGMAQWLKITPIGNDWMVVYDPVDEGITDNFIWCGQTKSNLCEALASMYLFLEKEGYIK